MVKHLFTPGRAWPICKDHVGRFEYAHSPELVTCKACIKKAYPKRKRATK